jgi:hypothetical protein
MGTDKRFFFWRTYDGQEIDLIEETEGILSAFEIKWGTKTRKIPGAFSATYPKANFAVIDHNNYMNFIL